MKTQTDDFLISDLLEIKSDRNRDWKLLAGHAVHETTMCVCMYWQ